MLLKKCYKFLVVLLCVYKCDCFIDFGVATVPLAIGAAGWLAYYIIPSGRPTCQPRDASSLKYELLHNLFGQHIVIRHLHNSVTNHMQNTYSSHALTLVFAGATGTGKNFVSTMIAESIHGKDSPYVHFYSGRLHFPIESEYLRYTARLHKEIFDAVSRCPYSIFIFDEIDKIPSKIIDSLKPFLDYSAVFQGVDFRKSIFIFLTNLGSLSINGKCRELQEKGTVREDMTYKDFEADLRKELFESDGLFLDCSTISHNIINLYLPFLPLERKHVEMCVRRELGLSSSPGARQSQAVERVMQYVDFHLIYSKAGCRRIPDIIAFEL